MSDAVNESHQEFWRPVKTTMIEEFAAQEQVPAMAEACPRCGTEFLLGSRFCHTCGGRRLAAINPGANSDAAEMAGLWQKAVGRTYSVVAGLAPRKFLCGIELPKWMKYLHFHEIQRWIGLPTASLIAFVIGLCCVAGALAVGFINVKTLVDWQAIQFYRGEWLLAAIAAFVAGILLKKP